MRGAEVTSKWWMSGQLGRDGKVMVCQNLPILRLTVRSGVGSFIEPRAIVEKDRQNDHRDDER